MSTSVQTSSRSSHADLTHVVPLAHSSRRAAGNQASAVTLESSRSRKLSPRATGSTAIRGEYFLDPAIREAFEAFIEPQEVQEEKPSLAKQVGENPLPEFISDDLWAVFRSNDLISEKGLRDFMIRRVYQRLKEEKRMSTQDAIVELKNIYPYLQLDTLRKIVYRIYQSGPRKSMLSKAA